MVQTLYLQPLPQQAVAVAASSLLLATLVVQVVVQVLEELSLVELAQAIRALEVETLIMEAQPRQVLLEVEVLAHKEQTNPQEQLRLMVEQEFPHLSQVHQ
jgi:hypothetical protein